MQGMTLNYVLLGITAMYLAHSIFSMIKGGAGDRRILRPVFMLIVFILVLIATVKGMDYMSFKTAIETGNWNLK